MTQPPLPCKMGQLNSSDFMKNSHTWAKGELDNWLHLGKPLSIQPMFLLAQTNDRTSLPCHRAHAIQYLLGRHERYLHNGPQGDAISQLFCQLTRRVFFSSAGAERALRLSRVLNRSYRYHSSTLDYNARA